MALKAAAFALLGLACAACGSVPRPPQAASELTIDLTSLPQIKQMGEFPGHVYGFATGTGMLPTYRLIRDEICLRVLPDVVPSNDAGNNPCITVDMDAVEELRSSAYGEYRQYCFTPELQPGFHLIYVELDTGSRTEVYSWEFSVE